MKKISEADFWSKANCKNEDQCWEWIRSLNLDGYGKCLFLGEQLAHRISYRLKVGTIPKGMCVLHSCDNRKCINPKHLFLGTLDDNMTDRNTKGRQAQGERHANARLTAIQVNEIRHRYANGGVTQETLGAEYGVTGRNICDIVRNRIWKGQL